MNSSNIQSSGSSGFLESIDWAKTGELVPAVIQDGSTSEVLMVGFMSQEALAATLRDKRVTFFSRTKGRLWQKGETSGHYLDVLSVAKDCDSDSLLIQVRRNGPVCHTGEISCFDSSAGKSGNEKTRERISSDPHRVFAYLQSTIEDRKLNPVEKSYTTSLFKDGISRIAQKVGEEAVELAIAAQHTDLGRCREEAADLLFHLLVLLSAKEIPLREVELELAKRIK